MGNYNILITNPQGERRHQFVDNTGMRECNKWLEEYGPAPIGWFYQLVNLNKKPRIRPDHILICGFNPEGDFVGSVKCHQYINGHWFSPKQAKDTLRKQGAITFTREKVWEKDDVVRMDTGTEGTGTAEVG